MIYISKIDWLDGVTIILGFYADTAFILNVSTLTLVWYITKIAIFLAVLINSIVKTTCCSNQQHCNVSTFPLTSR